MSDALGTQIRIDLINEFPHINCLIRAYRFTDITIDTFIGDI